ncbi:MAG: flagellin, partial [Tepidisphaeraceae bacterium]
LQIDSIIASVSVISKTTSFLGTKLLDGSGVIAASGKTQKIESTRPEDVGTVEDAGTEYTLADLTSGKALDISGGSSDLASKVIDAAIQSVGTNRGQVGAFQKYQVQTRIHEIDAAREHLVSAVSMIRDTDYAMEVSRGIRAELLEKTSLTAMMVAQTSSFSQHDRQKVLGLFL